MIGNGTSGGGNGRADRGAPANLPKRFYRSASVAPASAGGYDVRLDDRPVRTPGRNILAAPTAALADAVAGEWSAQADRIDPTTMPLTRLLNTAIDGVAIRMSQVRRDVAKYATTDLLLYRAEGPQALSDLQAAAWDPVLAWASEALTIRFRVATGLMPVAQESGVGEKVEAEIEALDSVSLTALHVITTLTGSVLLALAVHRGVVTVSQAWAAAHIDEDWQIEQWGADDEAMARRSARWREIEAAARLLELIRAT